MVAGLGLTIDINYVHSTNLYHGITKGLHQAIFYTYIKHAINLNGYFLGAASLRTGVRVRLKGQDHRFSVYNLSNVTPFTSVTLKRATLINTVQ